MLEDRLLSIFSFAILLLPLAGFLVLWAFGDWIRRDREDKWAGVLACVVVLAAFGLAAWSAIHFASLDRRYVSSSEYHRGRLEQLGLTPGQTESLLREVARPLLLKPHLDPERFARVFHSAEPGGSVAVPWISVGNLEVPFALLIDRLSLIMILVVTGVGSLIHIYSLGYMAHDEDKVRYFSYLNLFTFFMLLLVMGGNLPVMFVGWEGVGLCSYLLIGFWYRKTSAADAGKKAFIVNRIGDAGLILGMIVAFHAFGTLDLETLNTQAAALALEPMGQLGIVTVVCLLLFLGATGKSAQIPLHVWLPDAMEGPTPVSALIHAATMVTAGVYLVARLGGLFSRSATALAVVAVIGAATALMAATVALVQTDIKKVLAYSTISQLGYMFLACGVGAFGVAVFHLFTHAFFKALLFLGAGSVIHALSGEQDMRKMGGLWPSIPWTFATFAVGTLAIAGIPPLSGFFSKDEILAATLSSGNTVLFLVALLTAGLTAFYMTRLLVLTFLGRYRGGESPGHGSVHAHESPWTMLVPLVILAAGSVLAGIVQVPELLAPVVGEGTTETPHAPVWLPLLATGVALAGIAVAAYLYLLYTELPEKLARRLRGLLAVLQAGWGFDRAYDWFTRRVVLEASRAVLWRGLDARVIDGAVNGLGALVERLSRRVRQVQSGMVRGYALLMLGGAVAVVGYLLWVR